MKKFLLFLFFIQLTYIYSQLTPIVQFAGAEEFTSVIQTVTGNYIVSTESGSIMLSTDSGKSWNTVSSSINNRIVKLVSKSLDTLFAVGNGGYILRSINQGSSWQIIRSAPGDSLLNISFAENLIFVSGKRGVLLKSSDGGETWTKTTPTPYNINQIAFDNLTTLYAACSNGTTLKSTNAGNSWDTVRVMSATIDYVSVVIFNSRQLCFIGKKREVFATLDSFATWKSYAGVSSNDTLSVLSAWYQDSLQFLIAFSNGDIAQCTFYSGNFFIVSWLFKQPVVNKYFGSYPISNLGFILAGAGPSLTITTDRGVTWQNPVSSFFGKPIRDFSFSGNVGAVTSKPIDGHFQGLIYTTTDYGMTWSYKYSHEDFHHVEVLRPDLMIFGSYGIYASRDTGKTWVKRQLTGVLSSFNFTDTLNAYYGVNYGYVPPGQIEGRIYKTTNGGWNWASSFEISWMNPLFMKFNDPSYGWVFCGGAYSYILRKTENSGVTWVESYVHGPGWIVGVVIGYSGFIVFSNGQIQRTLDKGSSWVTIINQPGLTFSTASNKFEGNSLVGCANGTIYAMKNYGESYQVMPTGITEEITAIWLFDNYSFLVGTKNGRLYTGDARAAFGISDINDGNTSNELLPGEFNLVNYPNPFNGSSTISFDLPFNSDYKIRIFSPIGIEVFSDEAIGSKGRNNYSFNSTGLASGVYIYKIEAYGKSAIGKMILLK
jgi:photosystem II stability/assembly factor-like uncharacterized protein